MQPLTAPLPVGRSRDWDPIRCEACGRSYNYRSSYYCHRKYECGKEPQFQCPYCPHRSKHKKNLNQHIRRRHGVTVPPSGLEGTGSIPPSGGGMGGMGPFPQDGYLNAL